MALVKSVSADKKNNSLELNEFIKMIARDIKRDATGSRNELLEAFRSFQTSILIIVNNIVKNDFRSFDKDEDGKLSVDEMREIMVNLGEGPISETEFSVFIKVNFVCIMFLLPILS